MIGIRSAYRVAAAIPTASNITPIDATGLLIQIPAASIWHITGTLYFSVGATGGIRFISTLSQTPAAFLLSSVFFNIVAGTYADTSQTTPTAITDALANAGTHMANIDIDLSGHATLASTLQIQFAQNTSDVLTANCLAGSFLDAIQLQ